MHRDIGCEGQVTEAPKSYLKQAENLVGRYVHTHYEKGHLPEHPELRPVKNQGLVIAQHGEYYEVQWFSFWDGTPNESTMHRLDEMVFENWTFYLHQEDWIKIGDNHGRLIPRRNYKPETSDSE